jgi:hypothetical protein
MPPRIGLQGIHKETRFVRYGVQRYYTRKQAVKLILEAYGCSDTKQLFNVVLEMLILDEQ